MAMFPFYASAEGTSSGIPDEVYDWRPVRIGAGGFVTGMTVHPLNPEVRFARTDVGNAYRWDPAAGVWQPLIVRDVEAGIGLPANLAAVPSTAGVESLSVDPSNVQIVYLAFPSKRSADVASSNPSKPGVLYKSADGGLTFSATGLEVPMQPNGPTRNLGERIGVDPLNGDVVYYGSVSSGLRRSIYGASSWAPVTGGPDASANVLNVTFAPSAGSIEVNGQLRTANVFAGVYDGDVYHSEDGGQTWVNRTQGTPLSGAVRFSTVDVLGRLWVVRAYSRELWRFSEGSWTSFTVDSWWYVQSLAIDPRRPERIFALAESGAISRSTDDGASWSLLSTGFRYANKLGWLPQYASGFRSNGGILIDLNGRLWSPQGNEGVLTWKPSDKDSEPSLSEPLWTIQSQGIEEFVAHDIVLPPGFGDRAIVSVQDATGFRIDNLDQFTAAQIPLQDQLISNGHGLAYCPNAPEFVVVASSDANNTSSGANYSGFSTDGGQTWQPFGSRPVELRTGSIAVARRGDWGLGADRIVHYPCTNRPPSYSLDGGNSWQVSSGLPVNPDGTLAQGGLYTFALKQRLLRADPHTAGRFYFSALTGPLYASTDGGANWSPIGGTGLPPGRFHSQLEVNPAVPGDLWLADGWEGAFGIPQPHGLFRSTDDGANFLRLPGIDNAVSVSIGAGRGQPGDLPYTVYFYGKLSASTDWGIFRSTDGGSTWVRISYYPAGVFDRVNAITTSPETFGLVYVAFEGNSFAYGRPAQATVPTVAAVVGSIPSPVASGSFLSLRADATGLPLPSRQWQRRTAGSPDWVDIPGATQPFYSFSPSLADDGSAFRVVATNRAGSAASVPMTVNVLPAQAPAFSSLPTDAVVDFGGTATFLAEVTGFPDPALRWERQPPGGGSWTAVPGGTGPALTRKAVDTDDGARFRLAAKNLAGTVTTPAVTLSLRPLTPSASVSRVPNQTNLLVRFSASVTGGRLTTSDDMTERLGGVLAVRGQANSTVWRAAHLIDNNPATKWVDFTLDPVNRNSWIQFAQPAGQQVSVDSYALTSGDDSPERDPANWALLGSDDGTNWTTLDVRTDETFATRGQRRVFVTNVATPFRYHRLRIDKVANFPIQAGSVQLAEWELLRKRDYVFNWNFGDGNTSSARNPDHVYLTPGVYPVTLSVTDSVSTAEQTFDVPVRHDFVSWRSVSFSPEQLANPAEVSPQGDPDSDGYSNFLEYATGSDPAKVSSQSPGAVSINSAGKKEFSFERLRDDLVYSVEGSFDLQAWQTLSIDPGQIGGTVIFEDTDTSPKRFYRLRITPRQGSFLGTE